MKTNPPLPERSRREILAIAAIAAAVAQFPLAPQAFAQVQPRDFGDAPQVYPQAAHSTARSFSLGASVDVENGSAFSSDALGDDNNPAGAPDDEDGITWVTDPLLPGEKASLIATLTGPNGGRLDGWVDFNRDGDWADEGEQIFKGEPLQHGANNLSFSVPVAADAGADTFARFRVSFEGGLPPGPLPDNQVVTGEVEDYRISIGGGKEQMDFGDAPEKYPVTISQNGARHQVVKGVNLGQRIDTEEEGQPSSNALRDDQIPSTADDEDGIRFLTDIVPGAVARVEVAVVVPEIGHLDAWMDFNEDSDWNDEGEQIFKAEPLSSGVHVLEFQVPKEAREGIAFSRFRLSLKGGLPPTGAASEGEVEDYGTEIKGAEFDFGDAPENYPVTLSQNGARHSVQRGLNLGMFVDVERDGQPSVLANGDDAAVAGGPPDDEDGVFFAANPLIAGATAQVAVIASTGQSRLDAWVDFNGDGDWTDNGEQIFASQFMNFGTNDLSFAVPANAVLRETYARFRLSWEGGLRPEGPAPDGEVEDYQVRIDRQQLDYGDAPQIYPVMFSQNGARHEYQRDFHLGNRADVEPDGQPSAGALADDQNPTAFDDEDGVVFSSGTLVPGAAQAIQVEAASGGGVLNAWIDWNRDGDWADAGEKVFADVPLASGINSLTVTVPASAVEGESYGRFRFSKERGLSFSGHGGPGEVEDHRLNIGRRPDIPCDTRTHRGTNFWVTFPGNYDPDPDNRVNLRLFVVGPAGISGTVSIPGLGFSVNYVIPANGQYIAVLPREAELDNANDVVEKKGIHITAEREVAVYGLNKVWWTTDGYLALPTDVIGRRYIVQGYGNEFTGVPDLNGTQFAFVATEDGTTVNITPSVPTLGHPANVQYSVNLNQGETYQLRNTSDFNNDLSGTIIQADKPLSVFGSHQTANVPSKDVFFADHLVEQLLPAERAGLYFVAVPFATRSGDTFRFVAIHDSTSIQVNGVIVATINAGDYHEMIIHNPCRIFASKPIFVTQYANSSDFDAVENADPAMAIVPPIGMYLAQHRLVSANYGFAEHYLNIVAPTSVVGALVLDGAAIPAAAFAPVPLTPFSSARIKVTPGVHALSAAQPFGVTAYGWAQYESYAYPGGLFFGDTQPPELTCPPDIQVTLGGASTQFSCTTIVPDLRGQVEVTDNCGLPTRPQIQQTPAPGTVVGPGKHVITLSAFDQRGNLGICEVLFEVIDPTPLRLQCPQDMTFVCNTDEGAVVNYVVRASRSCGPVDEPEVVCDPPPGSVFPVGTTVVQCSVTDPATGEKLTCSFRITVVCNGGGPAINPSIGPNGNLTLNWNANATLQTSTDLKRWTNVPVDGSTYTVNTRAGEQAYYRLLINDE